MQTITPAKHPMGTGGPALYHAKKGPGGAVLEILHPRDRPPSVTECIRPGPQTKKRSLHDPWVTLGYHPEGALTLPWEVYESTSTPIQGAIKRGRDFRGSPEAGN